MYARGGFVDDVLAQNVMLICCSRLATILQNLQEGYNQPVHPRDTYEHTDQLGPANGNVDRI